MANKITQEFIDKDRRGFIDKVIKGSIGGSLMLMIPMGSKLFAEVLNEDEEASRAITYGTNESCRECHSELLELKEGSKHDRLSCEICHAPISEHIKDGKKIADMPTHKGESQIKLCLKCHQKTIGRPKKMPQIDVKEHLEERGVKSTHTCDQCHTVHAPLENINYVKKMRSLKEDLNGK